MKDFTKEGWYGEALDMVMVAYDRLRTEEGDIALKCDHCGDEVPSGSEPDDDVLHCGPCDDELCPPVEDVKPVTWL